MLEDSTRGGSAVWLRTGRWPQASRDGVELKFNPYHDPRNGQFTFAPGGARSLSSVIIARRRRDAIRTDATAGSQRPDARKLDATYRPDVAGMRLTPASFPRNPRGSRGGNIRAFQDPMTLEQVFPGLRDRPGGALVALADNILDLTGPGREVTADLTRAQTNRLIDQIKALEPGYRFDSLGFPQTLEGQMNQLNGLRFERAAAFLRVKGKLRPMQVETLRFVQARVDRAYERGLAQLNSGRLKIRLSEQEALGNFVDSELRKELRNRYDQYGIDSAGKGPVRVNRREDDSQVTTLHIGGQMPGSGRLPMT